MNTVEKVSKLFQSGTEWLYGYEKSCSRVPVVSMGTSGEKDFSVSGTFSSPDYLSVIKSKTDIMCEGSKFGLCIVSNKTFNTIANGKETISYSIVFNQNNSNAFRKELSNTGIQFLDYL